MFLSLFLIPIQKSQAETLTACIGANLTDSCGDDWKYNITFEYVTTIAKQKPTLWSLNQTYRRTIPRTINCRPIRSSLAQIADISSSFLSHIIPYKLYDKIYCMLSEFYTAIKTGTTTQCI